MTPVTHPAPATAEATTPEPCHACGNSGWVWTVVQTYPDAFLGTVADEVRDTCPECGPVPANNDQEVLADEPAIPADLPDDDIPF